MKFTILVLASVATSVAFAWGEKTKTTTQQTTTTSGTEISAQPMNSDPNTNDRFDNLDPRTNSRSTPAYLGADESRMDAAINSKRYTGDFQETQVAEEESESIFNEPMADTNEDQRLSGSSTEVVESEEEDRSALSGSATAIRDSEKRAEVKKDESNTILEGKGAAAPAATGAVMSDEMSSSNQYNENLTAQDTSRNKSSLEVVRQIRSEITDNKDLSVHAHNVKIISQNGQVFLKGPVANETEKTKVEEIAKRVAGNTAIINQTYVGSRSGSSTNE